MSAAVDLTAIPKESPRRRKLVRPRGAARLARDAAAAALRAREARAFPAALLGGLVDVTLVLEVPGVPGRVRVLTSRESVQAARDAASVVLDDVEWGALVCAAESDRAWSGDLASFCARKATDPGWVLDLDTALAGARPEAPRGWTIGRVLDRLGARLVDAV